LIDGFIIFGKRTLMKNIKTSASHPLRIDEVIISNCLGLIGMTFCPGKKQPDAASGHWNRDLETDLRAIKDWGASILISLMEEKEFSELKVLDLPILAIKMGLEWIHLPIVDMSTPSQFIENHWRAIVKGLKFRLLSGEKLVFHCKGGLGRTGTMAACLLKELKFDGKDAIRMVREARPGTIENPVQEAYVLNYEPRSDRISRDNFTGCLLGGAIGDALGGPFEFMSLRGIREQFGKQGVTDFEYAYGRRGAITDDTQMTLFTAEGLLRAYCRFKNRGTGPAFDSVTYYAYLRWLYTQNNKPEVSKPKIGHDGYLISIDELYARRAPGNSCLSALESDRMGTISEPINNSKGCGGVMRMAPVGLFIESPAVYTQFDEGIRMEQAFKIGCELAAITHGHPTGYLAAGVLSVIISRIIDGDALDEAIDKAITILRTKKDHIECLRAIESARGLAVEGSPSPESVEQLGGGWIAEEALAIGIYCSLVANDDFTKGVLLAVNHSGDSDSTGSIAGNILGALLGKNAIPKNWIEEVELSNVIEEISNDLFATYQDGEEWWNKYPGY
jgi:ADP-ribosyl-[dinitrogen reductase] hydrolase